MGEPAQISIYGGSATTVEVSVRGTYAITIVNIGANLILLELLGGLFGADLAVGRNEPVSGSDARAIVVIDLPFQGADVWELHGVSKSIPG